MYRKNLSFISLSGSKVCSLYLEVIRDNLSVSLFYLSEFLLIFHFNEVNTYPESSWNEAIFCENCQVFGFQVLLWCMLSNLSGSHRCILPKEDSLHRPLPFPEMLISHPENSSFTTYGYGKCKPRDIAIPIAVPRDIYIVRRYFSLFAFFLAPLIICGTKGICQIRERGLPSLLDQSLAERLFPQNLEEFLGQNIYILYFELLSSMNYEHSRI